MLSDNQSIFATKEQELLLQAALLDGEAAIDAWEQWKNAVDLEGHPDNGSFRLFPLLYKNLHRHAVEHPFMSRLRGIYRQSWYRNQRLFYDMGKVLQSLHGAGVRTMVMKGAALTVTLYHNYAVRPMTDIDVLVQPSQALYTIDYLRREGWKPLREITSDDLYYLHSVQLNDSSGREFDLHWHPYWDACRQNNDRDFWDRALPITFAGVPTLAPSPTDNLLHTIIHGVKYNQDPPIRWIADAALLIHSSDMGIDWEYFILQARKHRVVLRTREALNYIRNSYACQVPDSVIDAMMNVSVSRRERVEYQLITAHPNDRDYSIRTSFIYHLSLYSRITGETGIFHAITGFPDFLRWRFRKKNVYQLCSYLMSRSLVKIWARLFLRETSHTSGSS